MRVIQWRGQNFRRSGVTIKQEEKTTVSMTQYWKRVNSGSKDRDGRLNDEVGGKKTSVSDEQGCKVGSLKDDVSNCKSLALVVNPR